jgi:hypothetical protein
MVNDRNDTAQLPGRLESPIPTKCHDAGLVICSVGLGLLVPQGIPHDPPSATLPAACPVRAAPGYAAPSSYQIEMSHSDGFKLPPLADCLVSTILMRGFSLSQAFIWSSNARVLGAGID